MKFLFRVGLLATCTVAVSVLAAASVSAEESETSPDIECRFQTTGHSAVTSAYDQDGEWISRDLRGFQHLKISEHETVPLSEGMNSVEKLANHLWHYQRVSVQPHKFAVEGNREAGFYSAERTYLKFHDDGRLDRLLSVHELSNGTWHATLLRANSKFVPDSGVYFNDDLLMLGLGKCAAPGNVQRVLFNPIP
jgi:hypothetical protein